MPADEAALIFKMGEYEARIPGDRMYAKNHMWATRQQGAVWRFGLSAYAVRLLQDVYFLDWTVDPGTMLAHRQCVGSIESKKAESDLFSPCAGQLAAINPEALDDPGVINVDCYGDGWLLEIEAEEPPLLDPEQYVQHLAEAWKVAERTIKGQIR